MSHCVTSMIVETDRTDRFGDSFVAACMVHTHLAPCPHDGQPASPLPLHAWADQPLDDTIGMWDTRTHRQRPLTIHSGTPDDEPEHVLTGECWCQPVRIRPLTADECQAVIDDLLAGGGA